MAKLNRKEKQEFIELAKSAQLREDMRKISENRHNPFLRNGIVDADRVIIFLTEFNEFINHKMRPFRRIIDNDMRL